MVYMTEMVNKGVVIRPEHKDWINKNSINLSSWIRKKIDQEIKQEEKK